MKRSQQGAVCPRWCDFEDARRHPSNHVAVLGEVTTSVFSQMQVVSVTVECGLAETVPLPVISMYRNDNGAVASARLTWSEASTLAGLLLDGKRRYES